LLVVPRPVDKAAAHCLGASVLPQKKEQAGPDRA